MAENPDEAWPDLQGSDIVLPIKPWGGSCPVQYEINFEGHTYYIRYRGGWLTVTLDPDSTDKQVFEQKLGNDLDGFWSDEATNVYLGLISRAIQIGNLEGLTVPRKPEIKIHPFYRKGPYRGYDPHGSDGP